MDNLKKMIENIIKNIQMKITMQTKGIKVKEKKVLIWMRKKIKMRCNHKLKVILNRVLKSKRNQNKER